MRPLNNLVYINVLCIFIMRAFACLFISKAHEGINGTVSGTPAATTQYIQAMIAHPIFGRVMTEMDFKMSTTAQYVCRIVGIEDGYSFLVYLLLHFVIPMRSSRTHHEVFDCLRIKVHEEIVPMGVDPENLRATEGGRHAIPEEFHRLVEEHMNGRGMTQIS